MYFRAVENTYIPVQQEPSLVHGRGEENTGKATAFYVCLEEGRYFLPQSIKEQLVAYWERHQIQWKDTLSHHLSLLQILHDESSSGRVKEKKNPEEYMSVLNNEGEVIATNTVPPTKRRRIS